MDAVAKLTKTVSQKNIYPLMDEVKRNSRKTD